MGLLDFFFGNEDEKRLEELRDQEAGIVRLGEGAMELKKNELEQIRKEINQLKIDNPDNETIQSGFGDIVIGPKDDFPQSGGDIFENVKRNVVNTALEEAGIPAALNYDSGTNILESFQQEGAAGAADTVANYVKDYGVERGIQLALNTGIPINTVISVLNNPYLKPVTGPLMSNARTMFSDVTGGYGPRVYNMLNNPLDIFGSTGIMSNYGASKKEKLSPQPVQKQLTNNQINQIIQDEEDLTKPPVVINQPNPQQDFPIINQGGGNDQGGSQGGGGTVIIGGQPGGQPSADPVQETNRIRNIMRARAQGANIGFNDGGLATISRYLKGR